MSAIVLPKRLHPDFSVPWKKPAGQVSAINSKFLALYQRGYSDIAGGTAAGVNGTAILTGYRDARGFFRSGTGYLAGYLTYENNDELYGSGELTVFCIVDFLSNPSSNSTVHDVIYQKSFTSAAEPFYVVQIKRTNTSGASGEVQCQFNLGGTRNFLGGTTALQAGRYGIVLSIKDGVQLFYIFSQNGALIDFNESAHTGGGVTNYNTSMFVGGQNLFSAWTYGTSMLFDMFGVDNRAWTAPEIEAFGRDPFGYVLKPEVPMFYMPAAAGGGFNPYWAAGSNVIMNNGSP